jgi:hypothetical protein
MMTRAAIGRAEWLAVAGGMALGLFYTLSPLTVLMVPVLVLLVRWAGRDLSDRERRWLQTMLAAGVILRLLAVAGLFLTASDAHPFATFFGDEEMFKFRSIWLRNIGLGVPISAADFIYAVEETGKSYYLFILAYVQALVGDAPYGIHVLNMTLYLAAALLLYRTVRAGYGSLAAFGGLTVLLWLPSLFIWSISALKEPLYTFLAAVELLCALHIVRSRGWAGRVLSLLGVIVVAVLLERLRKGGILVAGIGTAVGLASGLIATRRSLLVPALVAVPLAAAGALMVPAVQDRALSILRDSAIYHVGHVLTPGFSYKTLESWYYINPAEIRDMGWGDAITYVFRSLIGFVVQPLPWTIESRSLLAYLPEHVLWLVMVAMAPVGFVAGLRRDPLLTCTLAAHGLVIVLMVALTSGNVGTLVRHRGLALPYFVWMSALGACEMLRLVARRPAADQPSLAYADR